MCVFSPTSSTAGSMSPSSTAPINSGAMAKGHRLSAGDYVGIAVNSAVILTMCDTQMLIEVLPGRRWLRPLDRYLRGMVVCSTTRKAQRRTSARESIADKDVPWAPVQEGGSRLGWVHRHRRLLDGSAARPPCGTLYVDAVLCSVRRCRTHALQCRHERLCAPLSCPQPRVHIHVVHEQ